MFMAKKVNDNVNLAAQEVASSEKITLRCVYGKSGIVYYFNPQKDKRGVYPSCVRRVTKDGDMILSDQDKNDTDAYFIPENAVIEVRDGQTFDLSDTKQRCEWEAIKNSELIAESRTAKDSSGNYKIDGTGNGAKIARYGRAELYIDRPGEIAEKAVTNFEKQLKAANLIEQESLGKLILIAKVFGRNMQNNVPAEIKQFLYQIAQKTPDKIIEAFTGGDLSLKLLFIAAREKRIIYNKAGVFVYGDDGSTILGSSEDSVIEWMKQSQNQKTLGVIKGEVFPEMNISNE